MTRFCPSCGTEVDESALFCPSCGHPLEPAEPAGLAEPAERAPRPGPEAGPAVPPVAAPTPAPRSDRDDGPDDDPGRTEAHPRPAASGAREARAEVAPAVAARPDRQIEIPVTWPTTLSGWLIGIGIALAALGVLIGIVDRAFNPVDVLLLPVLLLVAVTVFFSAAVPRFHHLALATLAVTLVAFGIGLDRIGFGGAGLAELLLFLGAAAAAIGAIVLAVGHDQPLGGRGS